MALLDEDTGATRSTTVDLVAEARDLPSPVRPGTGPPGRAGVVWAFVWLVYLISTYQAAFKLDGAAHRAAAVVVILGFSAAYLVIFYVTRIQRWVTEKLLPLPVRWGAMLGITALAVASCALIGQQATNTLVYLGVSTVLLLPTRQAWAAVLVIVVAAEVTSRTVTGWTPDDGSLGMSVFLGSLAVWGISMMIARNRQLGHAQQEIARMAVTEERTRFARDLHDLLGHSLTVITVKAELAGRLVPIDPEQAEKEINDVERLARDALADVRAAVAGYREVSLAGELVSARTALTAAGITAELPTALDDVPGDRRELFGWAVREGVTNVVRHSGAAVCRIAVDRDGVEVVDDGRGPSSGAAGNGLTGLRERAEEVGAAVSVGRGPEGGFRLRVGW